MRRWLSLVFILLSPLAAAAAPRTGLVLAGGGALGFAHVGVLQVLEREGVKIDYVAGTSMGAIVGAGVASGMTAEELEQFISATDWDALFRESANRRTLPYRMKPGHNHEILGDVKLGIAGGKLLTPTGAIQGVNILAALQKLYRNSAGDMDFNSLPIPYRAIAADIETGEAVILSRGDVALAARASMSVPGVFSPVEIDGRLLVDGGIANNLPVDVVRNMGADRLIVVELKADLKKRDDLRTPLDISGQIISLLLAQNTRTQIDSLGAEDLLILPELKGFSPTDFKYHRDLIARGEEAAQRVIEQIRKFSTPAIERQVPIRATTFRVKSIEIVNNSTIIEERIRSRILIREGELFDFERAEASVRELVNTGHFANVRYELEERENRVRFVVEEKPWLAQYLRVGFSLQDDFEGNSAYSMAAAIRVNRLNDYGAQFDFETEVGFTPRVWGELYQPLSPDSPWFMAAAGGWSDQPLFLADLEDIFAKYQRRRFGGELRFGRELDELGEFFIGAERYLGEVNRKIGSGDLPESEYDVGSLLAGVAVDTLDDIDFPKEGVRVVIRGRAGLRELGSPNDFQQFTGFLSKPFTFGRNTLLFRADGGVTFDQLPLEQSYTAGGFFDLSGVPINSVAASDYVLGRLIGYRQISETGGGLLGLGLYSGASVEIGSFSSDDPRLTNRNSLIAGSLFFGVDTPLFPLYLGVGTAEGGARSLYFAIGRQFRVSR